MVGYLNLVSVNRPMYLADAIAKGLRMFLNTEFPIPASGESDGE